MPVPFVPGPHVCDTPARPCCRLNPRPPSFFPAPSCLPVKQARILWTVDESRRFLSHGPPATGVIWRLVVAAIGRPLRAGFDLIYLVSLGPARLLVRGRPDQQTDRHALWALCTPSALPGSEPRSPLPPTCHLPHPDRAVTATRLMNRDKTARPVWFWSNPLRPRPSLFHAHAHREMPPCVCDCDCACAWRPRPRPRPWTPASHIHAII